MKCCDDYWNPSGAVLSDIAEPQLIWAAGGEVALDKIIMYRRADLAVLTPLLAEHTPPAVVRADPPRCALGHHLAGVASLVEQEPVAELRVVLMGPEQSVRPVGLREVGIGHRVSQPPVVGLASDLEYPARHRDGNAVLGQLTNERVHHFPGRFAWER